MIFISDLFSFAPSAVRNKINEICGHLRSLNLVAGEGVQINKLPSGTVISTTGVGGGGGGGGNAAYNGQWAVTLKGSHFCVPAIESAGHLILTEDRVLEVVTRELNASNGIFDSGWSWCYLHIGYPVVYSLECRNSPYIAAGYSDYSDDYIPLAIYSKETGLIQLQYGAVRVNRYFVYEDSSGDDPGGGSI